MWYVMRVTPRVRGERHARARRERAHRHGAARYDSPRVRRHFEEPSEKFYEDPFEERPTENSRTYENSEVFGREGRLSDFDL